MTYGLEHVISKKDYASHKDILHKDVYLSTKDLGCANVYLGKMIAFTEALSELKNLEEGKTI